MEHRPADYAGVRYFFSAQEWLAHRLGAEPVTVLPNAAYGPYYWDREQCALVGLDFERFPPMAALGSVIGQVREGWTGLAKGIPIVAGAPDFIMALIGAGVMAPGKVCDRAGSSEGINVCTREPHYGPGLRTLPHAAEGLWNLGAVLPASGRLFDWYRSITGQESRSYAEILDEICPPHTMNGPLAAFPALYLHGEAGTLRFPGGLPDRTELGRAILESLGFMVRGALERLESQGFPVTGMVISGGQAKSPRWNQLKADITGVRLQMPEIADGELAGDACAAAFALGEAGDIAEAAQGMIRIQGNFEPRKAVHARYEERYRAYREAEQRLALSQGVQA
jgi:sugar (pentulose or hexulose) kinase